MVVAIIFSPTVYRIKFIIEKQSTLQVSNYRLYVRQSHNDWLNCYKRFYDLDTNDAAFCVTQQMSIISSLLCNSNDFISKFNHLRQSWKRGGILANREILKPLIISLVIISVKGGYPKFLNRWNYSALGSRQVSIGWVPMS